MPSSAGAKIIDNVNFPAIKEFVKLNQEVRGVVRSLKFNRNSVIYLASLAAETNNINTAEGIIRANEAMLEDFLVADIGKLSGRKLKASMLSVRSMRIW